VPAAGCWATEAQAGSVGSPGTAGRTELFAPEVKREQQQQPTAAANSTVAMSAALAD